MKLNIVFLLIAIVLSIVSKALQFLFKMKLGNIVVIVAAIFFILAILFSMPKFKLLSRMDMAVISLLSCGVVVSFQIMMMLLVEGNQKIGWLLLVPLLISALLLVYKWFQVN